MSPKDLEKMQEEACEEERIDPEKPVAAARVKVK